MLVSVPSLLDNFAPEVGLSINLCDYLTTACGARATTACTPTPLRLSLGKTGKRHWRVCECAKRSTC